MKRQPYLLILSMIIAIGGIGSGIIAWMTLPDMLVEQLQIHTIEQMQRIGISLTVSDSITTILKANILDMMRIYFFSICLVGIPLLCIILFIKCFSIGFVLCILLQHSFLLVVSRILYVPILIIAAQAGTIFALKIIQNQIDRPIQFLLRYTVVFLGIILCVIGVSILDGLSGYYYFVNL